MCFFEFSAHIKLHNKVFLQMKKKAIVSFLSVKIRISQMNYQKSNFKNQKSKCFQGIAI